MAAPTALLPPHEAIARLVERLAPVSGEEVDLDEAGGRVLAEDIASDRPSPSCDVSAMDGYAVRLADLDRTELPVSGEVAIGTEPPELAPGAAVMIFTGGAVPAGAEAVIPRELVEERAGRIGLPGALDISPGQHIRRKGENLGGGEVVIEKGIAVDAAVAGALASFGIVRPRLFQRVRIGVMVTGDEVLPPEAAPTPWQLRDSNGSTLRTLVDGLPWAEAGSFERVTDEPDLLGKALGRMLGDCRVIMLTGGVSMGDYDYVPQVLQDAGADIVFHRLAQRPGKPMLGAVGPDGEAILGLPGNPVSVAVSARRIGMVALRRMAGFADVDPPPAMVTVEDPDADRIDLWWHRLVCLIGPGRARLVPTRGSGDLVSAARSTGFVAVPPGEAGPGPWPYYSWHAC